MQVKLAGKNNVGFSILEIVIALALLMIFIVGAVEAIAGTQYWRLTSVTAKEALEINQILMEKIRAESLVNFESASTTNWQPSKDGENTANSVCRLGGFCYYKQIQITDFSHLPEISENIEIAICCLGSTMRQARTKDNFYKIDHDGVIQFAKYSKARGARKFIVVSAAGSSAKSKVFYNKVKGMVEEKVSMMG
jgi:type II secretory pathway pseudopilin PulG